jgi:hypothetical protein
MVFCVSSKIDDKNKKILIFFFAVGKMTMEMGDRSTIRCVTSDLICELDFKTKVSLTTSHFFNGKAHPFFHL